MGYNVKLHVNNIAIGMFISALDRSWIETPFPLQGLYLRSMHDIDTVRLYCDHVYVDPDKSWIRIPHSGDGKSHSYNWEAERRLREKFITDLGRRGEDGVSGPKPPSLETEIVNAKRIYSESSTLIASVLEDIRNSGKFDVVSVKSAAADMVDSILRNSSALLWLSQLRNKDDYSYQHAINVCILATALGRHLALPRDKLTNLAIAGLMQDIGLLQFPTELIRKSGPLSREEQDVIKSHVTRSIELLRGQPGINADVIGTVADHHERYDGSGYPRGLKANEVSLFAGITGLCDCFDAMVSDRHYAQKITSFHALMILYGLREKAFNPALVERFIQCIGIYPIGSLVELNSGEVAIVVEQRRNLRLKPRLLVVLDAQKKSLAQSYDLDLANNPETKDGKLYQIKEVLPSGAYDLDPTEYFLC